MKYLFLICSDGVATAEKTAAMREHLPGWVEEMDARGVRGLGHPLKLPATGVTVRVRGGETLVSDGETLVTDGPFAEAKEHVGGFDLIDCADLDEAIEIAAKHPVSWFHSIEIRPFAEDPSTATDTAPDSAGLKGEMPTERSAGAPAPGRERYLLLMFLNGIAEPDEEEAAIQRDAAGWLAEVDARGTRIYGHPLEPADTATTVRVRDGKTLISDGPFVETKEFIGGFDILHCSSRQEAIDLAAKHPLARYHRVEVRPFAEEG